MTRIEEIQKMTYAVDRAMNSGTVSVHVLKVIMKSYAKRLKEISEEILDTL